MGRISGVRWLVGILWMGALFASDQGLKKWSTENLKPFEARPIAGSKTLLLSRHSDWTLIPESAADSSFPEPMTLPYRRYWIPVVWCIVALFFLSRVRRGETRGFFAFCTLLAGGAAQWWGAPVHTLQIAFQPNRYLPFNLADVWVLLGGASSVFFLLLEAFGFRSRATESSLLNFDTPGILKRYRFR